MRAAQPPLENAVFSRQGKWGLLVSGENHLLAGGTATFIDVLLDRFPASAWAPVEVDVSLK
jgi:hypothetical protein